MIRILILYLDKRAVIQVLGININLPFPHQLLVGDLVWNTREEEGTHVDYSNPQCLRILFTYIVIKVVLVNGIAY